ncbi:MAG: tetraacyldisaccharide 4'-kinase [Pseudomonadota bacterium]
MRIWLERMWYGQAGGSAWLLPVSWLFLALVQLRRQAYRRGWLASGHPGRPVVVIGNLTVGGSGKTPLTVWLACALAARGLRVGIASRGYGGRVIRPAPVSADSDPVEVGDEPVLLARRSGARVVVGRDRLAAARLLAPDVDVILADDGLQHYPLQRDLEILVIDGERRFGNGRLLPAGPLREPVSRAAHVDAIVVNGGAAAAGEIAMQVEAGEVVSLDGGCRLPLAAYAGRQVHAVAGIGHPARFYATLRAAGVVPIEHALADHAALTAADLAFGDTLPVLMTEKDAVKCRHFPPARLAFLEVSAQLAPAEAERLLDRIAALAIRP